MNSTFLSTTLNPSTSVQTPSGKKPQRRRFGLPQQQQSPEQAPQPVPSHSAMIDDQIPSPLFSLDTGEAASSDSINTDHIGSNQTDQPLPTSTFNPTTTAPSPPAPKIYNVNPHLTRKDWAQHHHGQNSDQNDHQFVHQHNMAPQTYQDQFLPLYATNQQQHSAGLVHSSAMWDGQDGETIEHLPKATQAALKTTQRLQAKFKNDIIGAFTSALAQPDEGEDLIGARFGQVISTNSTSSPDQALSTPLGIYEDVQLHISQLLLESHLNTYYLDQNGTENDQNDTATLENQSQNGYVAMTNFILPPDQIQNTTYSPWERRDTIGHSILGHLLTQEQTEVLKIQSQHENGQFAALHPSATPNQRSEIKSPLSMVNNADAYLKALHTSFLCQNAWTKTTQTHLYRNLTHYFNTFNSTRGTKTAQKGILSEISNYVTHFFHPGEHLQAHSVYFQLLRGLSRGVYGFSIQPNEAGNGNGTSSTPFGFNQYLLTFEHILFSQLQPTMTIPEVITSVEKFTAEFSPPKNTGGGGKLNTTTTNLNTTLNQLPFGAHNTAPASKNRTQQAPQQTKSVLHDLYELLFLYIILGDLASVLDLCLNPHFYNTPHYQPLMYIVHIVLNNLKSNNPTHVSERSKRAIRQYLPQLTLSLNTTQSSQLDMSDDALSLEIDASGMGDEPDEFKLIANLYRDELSSFPTDPTDRFVYQSHLWKAQQWGNHINYRLTTSNKLYWTLKLLSGDISDVLPIALDTLYQSTTLGSVYGSLLTGLQQQFQQRNLAGSKGTKQTKQSLRQMAQKAQNSAQHLNQNEDSDLLELNSTALTAEQGQFVTLVDQNLQGRFNKTWGWLIGLLFSLYHTPKKSKQSAKSRQNQPNFEDSALFDDSEMEDMHNVSIFDFTVGDDQRRSSKSGQNTHNDLNATFLFRLSQSVKRNQELLFGDDQSQSQSHSSTPTNINLLTLDFFATLVNIQHNDLSSLFSLPQGAQNIDLTPLWDVFMSFSTSSVSLLPTTAGLQRHLILTSLPQSVTQSLGLSGHGSVEQGDTGLGSKITKLGISQLSAPLQRLLHSIIPSSDSDESVIQHITTVLGQGTGSRSANGGNGDFGHNFDQNNAQDTSTMLQSLNLKWFVVQYLLQFLFSMTQNSRFFSEQYGAYQNSLVGHNGQNGQNAQSFNPLVSTSSTFTRQLVPFADSPVFTIQSIIADFKTVLLTLKQWQWAIYVTQHTIHQKADFDLIPTENDIELVNAIASSDQDSLPKTLLKFSHFFTSLKDSHDVNPFQQVNDVCDILFEYISPIPHDGIISLQLAPNQSSQVTQTSQNQPTSLDQLDNGQHLQWIDETEWGAYPLPPVGPEWLEPEHYLLLGQYLSLLHHLGLSSAQLIAYYSNIKQLETHDIGGNHNNANELDQSDSLNQSLIFNQSLLNDSGIFNLSTTSNSTKTKKTPKKTTKSGLPSLQDDITHHQQQEAEQQSEVGVNIIAQTVISGYQVGAEEIAQLSQFLTTLFILEQQSLSDSQSQSVNSDSNFDSNSDGLRCGAGGESNVERLGLLVDSLFKKSTKSEKMEVLFSPEAISRLMIVIIPLQQFIEEYQAGIKIQREEAQKKRMELAKGCRVELERAKNDQNGKSDQNGQNDSKPLVGTESLGQLINFSNHSTSLTSSLNSTLIQTQHNTSLINGLIDAVDTMNDNGANSGLVSHSPHNHSTHHHSNSHLLSSQVDITNNSLTDQWLIKYCHVPDVVITLARYLASVPSATWKKRPTSSTRKALNDTQNDSQTKFFSLFLMLKLEQQWVQHCINYIRAPYLYSEFSLVYRGQEHLDPLFLHNQGFLTPSNFSQSSHQPLSSIDTDIAYQNFTSLRPRASTHTHNGLSSGSFFGHFPQHFNILLSGPITSPTALSLLQDLTTYDPILITNSQSQPQQEPQNNKSLFKSQQKSSFLANFLNPPGAATQSLSQQDTQNVQLSIPIEQFFLQRYAIHTTFISTFSTHISPLLVKLSTWDYSNENGNGNQSDQDDPNAPPFLPPTYFQSQLTYLTCLYFLPQTNYWAEQCQIVDPELYLGHIHANLNPIFTQLLQNNPDPSFPSLRSPTTSAGDESSGTILVQQHLMGLGTKLVQLATRESVEMIWNFTQYYVQGLVYRYIALGETIEGLLMDGQGEGMEGQGEEMDQGSPRHTSLRSPGSNFGPSFDPQAIGIVCDSIDLLLGDIEFVLIVGHKVHVKPLKVLSERLIVVKGGLFQVLGA